MMTPLYGNGLSDELFLEMLGKTEALFQSFPAHGSGWVLQRVNELYIKTRKALPPFLYLSLQKSKLTAIE